MFCLLKSVDRDSIKLGLCPASAQGEDRKVATSFPLFSSVGKETPRIGSRAQTCVYHLPKSLLFQLPNYLGGKINLVVRWPDTRAQKGQHLPRIGSKFVPHLLNGRGHDPSLGSLFSAVHQTDGLRFAAIKPNRPTIRHSDHQWDIFFPGNQSIYYRNYFSNVGLSDDRHSNSMSLLGHDTLLWQTGRQENFRKIIGSRRRVPAKSETMHPFRPLQLRETKKIH